MIWGSSGSFTQFHTCRSQKPKPAKAAANAAAVASSDRADLDSNWRDHGRQQKAAPGGVWRVAASGGGESNCSSGASSTSSSGGGGARKNKKQHRE